jgi:hypothetical protein
MSKMPVRAHLINPVVRAILRSPLHRMLSGSVLALTYTGRRSNRRYVLPVMYAAGADELIVIVGEPESKTWWRNFDGKPRRISVRLHGREQDADARLLTVGTQAHGQALSVYQRRFPKALIEPTVPIVVITTEASADA